MLLYEMRSVHFDSPAHSNFRARHTIAALHEENTNFMERIVYIVNA